MIIERKETEIINSIKGRILVFGRRKTGKSFIIKNFIKHDYYFFVKRDRSVLNEEKSMIYDAFFEGFKIALNEEKTIVVDEFHRLPEGFFDYLHYTNKKGRVILVSSTLALAKRFFSSKSPLLGLFSEVLVPLPTVPETLKAIKFLKDEPKAWLELAVLLREPMFAQQITKESRQNPRELIAALIQISKKTIPALIGEIFIEEERTLSTMYEGILRAIATGKQNSGEISSYLFSRTLLPKDDPSQIQQHLNILTHLGIIKKTKVFNKKRYSYGHTSPVARLFYLMDEKYNISEREVTKEELIEILNEQLPMIIEENVRAALSQKYSLIENIVEEKDFGIDGVLLKFKQPKIALEVKWKDKIKNEELQNIANNLKKFKVERRILFVPDKKDIDKIPGIEILDAYDLI